MQSGLQSGLKVGPQVSPWLGGVDPANDGSSILLDSSREGGVRLGIPSPGLRNAQKTGLWMPSDWGQVGGWAKNKVAAASRLVNICVWGDSISMGYLCSAFNKSWPQQMAAILQGMYGDGGSGFLSVTYADPALFLPATPNANGGTPAWTVAGLAGGATTGWDFVAWGVPNGYVMYPHTSGDTTATATCTVRGRYIDIWWASYTAATAKTFSYQIDGGTITTVQTNTQAYTGSNKTTIDTGVIGTHTVKLACVTGQPQIAGVTGRNPTGICVHNMSKTGRQSGEVGISTGFTAGQPQNYGASIFTQFANFDLTFLAVGVNDAQSNVVPGAFRANLYVTIIQAQGSPAAGVTSDLVIIADAFGVFADPLNTTGTGATGDFDYPDLVLSMKNMAEVYGAAFLNLWPASGGTAYNPGPWDSSHAGYWGSVTVAGAAGTNYGHLSDAGCAYVGSLAASLLTA